MTDLRAQLEADLAEAERKAWDSLARNKFHNFGYWAADVVKIHRRLRRDRSRKFPELVDVAREVMRARYGKVVGPPPASGTVRPLGAEDSACRSPPETAAP